MNQGKEVASEIAACDTAATLKVYGKVACREDVSWCFEELQLSGFSTITF